MTSKRHEKKLCWMTKRICWFSPNEILLHTFWGGYSKKAYILGLISYECVLACMLFFCEANNIGSECKSVTVASNERTDGYLFGGKKHHVWITGFCFNSYKYAFHNDPCIFLRLDFVSLSFSLHFMRPCLYFVFLFHLCCSCRCNSFVLFPVAHLILIMRDNTLIFSLLSFSYFVGTQFIIFLFFTFS